MQFAYDPNQSGGCHYFLTPVARQLQRHVSWLARATRHPRTLAASAEARCPRHESPLQDSRPRRRDEHLIHGCCHVSWPIRELSHDLEPSPRVPRCEQLAAEPPNGRRVAAMMEPNELEDL